MSTSQDNPDQTTVRANKLIELSTLVHGNEAEAAPDYAEDVLNLYSKYAVFEDGNRGIIFTEEDVAPRLGEERKRKGNKNIAAFFYALSKVKLQKGEVLSDGNVVWADCEKSNSFLPDDTDFQLTAPQVVLWESEVIEEKAKSLVSRDDAFQSLECNLEDHGNHILWRLDVPEEGFPVGEDIEGGQCILREHHRQVMFVAFSWLLQNASALGLTAKDTTSLPPAVVAAVCGCAGIGKSRSLIFLMWFLLQRKSSFLLEATSKQERFYALVRPREKSVRILTSLEDVAYILAYDRSLICIVDPEQSQKGAKPKLSPILNMKGITGFTSPSADPNHLPRGDKEACVLRTFWVSPWPLLLLQAVNPFFSAASPLLEAQVTERFEVVGGIVRAMFRLRSYTDRKQTIDSSNVVGDVDALYHALTQDTREKHMTQKVPQAFLGYHSKLPFTYVEGEKNVWVDFLSQRGRRRYGMHLYNMLRTGKSEYDDYSSAGMFFERWGGSLLSGRQSGISPKQV